jgi:hypothetical protein
VTETLQHHTKTELRNLTPHDIVLRLPGGSSCVLRRSPQPTRLLYDPRLSTDMTLADVEVPVFDLDNIRSGELPPRQDGIYLVVSVIVAATNKDRDDLLIVHDEIRDSSGQVIACKALARFS